MAATWKKQWNSWVAPTRYPGVYRRRDGGYLVRARVTLPNGDRPEIRETLLECQTDAEASQFLVEAKQRMLEEYRAAMSEATASTSLVLPPQVSTSLTVTTSARLESETTTAVQQLAVAVKQELSKRDTGKSFREFARDVARHRAVNGNNATPASRDKFDDIINHLVDGTTVVVDAENDQKIKLLGLGDYLLEDLTAPVIEKWKASIGECLIAPGYYAPTTANGWLKTLRSLMKEAAHLYDLRRNEAALLSLFPLKGHQTYTREDPNALRPAQAYHFMRLLREQFPQHYGMTYLGLYTGARPCNLRPLRRKGLTSDLDWSTGKLYIARSQTRGQKTEAEIRPRTKQGTQYYVQLPQGVLDVLAWHVRTQLVTANMLNSDLLFPGVHGKWRSPSVLDKPFEAISLQMKLGFRLTPKGLRRTFNDLARRAKVDRSVTRSISGHLTEEMQELYESVGEDETCKAVRKMVDLVESSQGSGKPTPGAGRPDPQRLEALAVELRELLESLKELPPERREHQVVTDAAEADEASDSELDADEEPIAAE